MKDGDIVRWYLNSHEYITGVVVEECGYRFATVEKFMRQINRD